MAPYNPTKIEKKWQKVWASKKASVTRDHAAGRENKMILVEFPYPSGNLHMGHWYAFALPDMYARYWKMKDIRSSAHRMEWKHPKFSTSQPWKPL